jgi:hypothetical protein
MALGKDYVAKKVAEADVDGMITAEITRFIGHDEKATAATD